MQDSGSPGPELRNTGFDNWCLRNIHFLFSWRTVKIVCILVGLPQQRTASSVFNCWLLLGLGMWLSLGKVVLGSLCAGQLLGTLVLQCLLGWSRHIPHQRWLVSTQPLPTCLWSVALVREIIKPLGDWRLGIKLLKYICNIYNKLPSRTS